MISFVSPDDLGQRALVGKVNMNQNSPDYYIEKTVEESVSETRRYVTMTLQFGGK